MKKRLALIFIFFFVMNAFADKKKKIETLICKGDGLGIQGKISG